MDEKFLDILNNIQSQIGKIGNDVSDLKSDVSTLKSDVSSLKSDVSTLKSDVSTIKDTVERIEANQNDDVMAMLNLINDKVETIRVRQDETDSVVDILSVRTTRLQAKLSPQ